MEAALAAAAAADSNGGDDLEWDAAAYDHPTFGEIILGLRGPNISREMTPVAYLPADNGWAIAPVLDLLEPSSPARDWIRPSLATSGDYLYVLGGFDRTPDNSVRGAIRLDILAGVWESLPDMNASRDNTSAVGLAGRVFALGGNVVSCDFGDTSCVRGAEIRTVESYDPSTGTWTLEGSMRRGRNNFDTVALDGRIYAIGGRASGEAIANVERYTP